MNFFAWKKKKMFHSQDIQIFMFLVNPKFVASSKTLLHFRPYTFDCFFRIHGSIKMRFGQVLVWLMAKPWNFILVLLWRLETCSEPFYNFMKWHCKELIFSRLCLLFFNCFIALFQRSKKPQTHHDWFLMNYWRVVNKKCLDLEPSPWNHARYFLNILLVTYLLFGQVSCPNSLPFKRQSKMNTTLCANSRHDSFQNWWNGLIMMILMMMIIITIAIIIIIIIIIII